MAASRSTEHPGPLRALLSLGRVERFAALGAIVCIGSLALPWYTLRLAGDLGRSGIASFGFAEAALLITLAAALMLLIRVGGGRRPPLPLHEGTLLAVAGIWSALIVGFLMIDRPTATLADFPTDYRLGYGIFVAMGGAVVLALAGLRIRSDELARQAGIRSSTQEAEAGAGARSPTSASPARSRRSRS